MSSKAELEQENDELRAQLSALREQLGKYGLLVNPNGAVCSPELGPKGLTKCGDCDCGRA